MVSTEQYFNDKIDWKKFNFMLDCCLELEDQEIWYCLDVMVRYKIKDKYTYKTIYYYYQYEGEKNYVQLTDNLLREYIVHYETDGLFYMFSIEKKKKISEKIRKKLELIDIKIDASVFWKYIYK